MDRQGIINLETDSCLAKMNAFSVYMSFLALDVCSSTVVPRGWKQYAAGSVTTYSS
jgi:hypothetical protein